MIALTVVLAVLVGVSLGLLGGGGSILTVPLLVYVAGAEPKSAIAMSLLVVGVTSAVGVAGHAREGRVQWRTGLVFAAGGVVGALAGSRFAQVLSGKVLLVAFGVMMLVTAVAMLRGRKEPDPDAVAASLPVAKAAGYGAGVGVVTGTIGAGGGFLVVPALALLGGLAMPVAVATSLVVITANTLGGFVGYAASVPVDWGLASMVTAAAVVGALLGTRLVGVVQPARLRKAFGWFVLVMSVVVLGAELVG